MQERVLLVCLRWKQKKQFYGRIILLIILKDNLQEYLDDWLELENKSPDLF